MATNDRVVVRSMYEYFTYRCENGKEKFKTFSLYIESKKSRSTALLRKLGEDPPFGPPIPARVISLVGPDRELFLKGRRAELRGLGIGAFAYYRRVLDQQKGRIIAEMRRVAVILEAPASILQLFDEAMAEDHFSSAIDKIKDAIPESLRIKNENPLLLLHDAVSEGLHRKTDAECLELATSIRVVLTELAERISNALKDDQELKQAVDRLRNRKKV